MIIFPKHLYRRCACRLEDHCAICTWGAAICMRCSGIEGELPTDCPGEEMNYHRKTGWIAEDVTRYERLRAMYGPGAPA